MKADWSAIESFRWSGCPLGDSPVGSHYGAFRVEKGGTLFQIIAADGEDTGWEHVSMTVSYRVGYKHKSRMPTWEEMCWLKSMFWEDDECVVQFHPPKSEYVNNHSKCLHLWKCVNAEFPIPDSILVGIKGLSIQ